MVEEACGINVEPLYDCMSGRPGNCCDEMKGAVRADRVKPVTYIRPNERIDPCEYYCRWKKGDWPEDADPKFYFVCEELPDDPGCNDAMWYCCCRNLRNATREHYEAALSEYGKRCNCDEVLQPDEQDRQQAGLGAGLGGNIAVASTGREQLPPTGPGALATASILSPSLGIPGESGAPAPPGAMFS